MSQLYRQMEEDVARKVRETMELADARRKALTPTEDVPQRPPRKKREKELGHESEAIDASVRIIGSLTKELSRADLSNVAEDGNNRNAAAAHIGFEGIRDNVDEMLQSHTRQADDFPEPLRNRELAQGALNLAQKAAQNIDHKADDTNQRHLAEGALILAQSAARNVDNDVDQSDNVHLNLALAQGALHLAQNPVRNFNADETVFEDKREPIVGELNLALAEGALNLAKNAARNIDDNDPRALADGALNLAQKAAWNVDNEVYKSEAGRREIAEVAQNAARDLDVVGTAEVNQRDLAQGALHLAQRAAKNIDNRSKGADEPETRGQLREDFSIESVIGAIKQQKKKLQLGFDHFEATMQDENLKQLLDDINKKSLAEHDRRVTAAAEAKVRTVSMDLQNIEMLTDDNDYNTPDVDESTREFAAGALNLAQAGARNLEEDVYETGDAKLRELGKGALGLARGAAKRQLSEAVGSLEDQPTVQLGFGLLENAAGSELEETQRVDGRAGRGGFNGNLGSSRSQM